MRINWNIPILNTSAFKLQANCSYNAGRVKNGNPLSGLKINLNAYNKQGLFKNKKRPKDAVQ